MGPIWLAILLVAADGGGPSLSGSVAASGGYDAALLVAPGVGAAGSAMASATATLGASFEPSPIVMLYAGAALDGSAFPSLPELGRTAAGAEASCLVDVAGPLSVVAGVSGGWSWYVDPARSGGSAAVRGSLVLRPAAWLAARAGYAHAWRTAADPIYGTSLDRLLAEVEFRPWRSTWLSLTAFGERGDATFYEEVAPPSTGADAATFVPYRAPATTIGVLVGVEQGIGGGFSLEAAASLRRTDAPGGPTTGPAFTLAIVWRSD
ncbi:MAG TPA: hypothetical protein VFM45_10445 [Anaeromyxobacteraceae bacterium]|nr:hypothetical protein [Anaeromyxobacteraceae bacterium]